jgi:hypothetical protein
MNHRPEIMAAGVLTVLCAVVAFAQSTDYTIRQIRDPVQFQEKVNSDMTTIGSRLSAVESSNLQTTASAVTVGALSTTGAVTIAEGALTDSKIVSADIKDGEVANADLAANGLSAAKITVGNLPVAQITNAVYGSGTLVTNDVIVAGNTTNRWILAPVGGVYVVRSITAL